MKNYKKLKIWEKGRVSRYYWDNELNKKRALKWLFEDKLDILNNDYMITFDDFRNNNLYGLMTKCFHSSPYEALNYIYPNKYKPWERCCVPRSYWDNEDNIKEALHWLFEDKLDIENNNNIITLNDFKKYRLYGLINNLFHCSIYEALNYIYPNKYKPWERCRAPKRYWENEDNVKEALKWLFEEKLDIKDINNNYHAIIVQDFKKYRLDTVLRNIFNGSIYKTVQYYKYTIHKERE